MFRFKHTTMQKSSTLNSSVKNTVSAVALMGLMATGITAHAQPKKVAGFTIEKCHEEFEKVNFCNKASIKEYKNALKYRKVNFNKKYILHFFDADRWGFSEMVVIDPRTKQVYMSNIQVKTKGEPSFSKHSNTVCFDGEISGYRQDDEGHFCYEFGKDDTARWGKSMTRVFK